MRQEYFKMYGFCFQKGRKEYGFWIYKRKSEDNENLGYYVGNNNFKIKIPFIK